MLQLQLQFPSRKQQRLVSSNQKITFRYFEALSFESALFLLYSSKFAVNVLDLSHIELATEEDKSWDLDFWAKLFKAKTWEKMKMSAPAMTEQQIISLFTKDTIKEYHIINTSHGDDDFREAIICTFDSGKKLVIKTAHNSFTSVEHIKMWQRCIEEYRKLGYYSPRIFESVNGTFPTVFYKGQECIVYAEEFSLYSSVKDCTNVKPYRDNLYLMTAKIAKQQFDYTDFPSAYCLFDIFPGDELDEVTQNALEFQRYCTTLPKCFELQTVRMFRRWEDNRKQLEKIYFELPFSVFQADFNDSNVLVDSNGQFVGVIDFNLAGKDEFLNYLFREIYIGTFEEELAEIRRALKICKEVYSFTKEEQYVALLIYRCVKPLWYTRVKTLKEAGNDLKLIQKCLDEMELAQTKEIDFRSVM